MLIFSLFVFFFKQKTAYEMRISDWSSDVCSSDLAGPAAAVLAALPPPRTGRAVPVERDQSGVVRQPLFRPGQRIRRDRRRASSLAGDTPMMAANSQIGRAHV